MWLIGGRGIVELVIITKFTKHSFSRMVEGDIEVYKLGAEGSPSLLQKEVKSYMLIIDIFY